MGWNWRSSKNFGGFRLNLSSKGIGWSAGVKGFRMGRDAHGRSYTHTSIPGTGLYNRSYHSKKLRTTIPNSFFDDTNSEPIVTPDHNYESYFEKYKIEDDYDPSLERMKTIWATAGLVGSVLLFIFGLNVLGFIALVIGLIVMFSQNDRIQEVKQIRQLDTEVLIKFDQNYTTDAKGTINFLKELNQEQLLTVIVNRVGEISDLALKSEEIFNKIHDPVKNIATSCRPENLEKWFLHKCWYAILSARNDRPSKYFEKSKFTENLNDMLADMGSGHGIRYAERNILSLLDLELSVTVQENISYVMAMVYFQAGNFEEASRFSHKSIKLEGENKQSAEELLKVCDPKIKTEHRLEYVEYINLGYEEWYELKKKEKIKFLDKHNFTVDMESLEAEIICELSEILGKISKTESEEITQRISLGNIEERQKKALTIDKEQIIKAGQDKGFITPSQPEVHNELESLIGLDEIKDEVKRLLSFVRVNQKRKQQGLPEIGVSLHSVFYGPPGTGKTTVARIIGRALKEMGILEKGHITEVDRAGLVGGYLGQTAIKTKEVLENSLDGVLFIDEAYSLSNDDDSYGKEAIDTILKFMEDNRGRLVVIVAGYKDEMSRFLKSNPGLKSRFNNYFYFKNYSKEELLQILVNLFSANQFHLDDSARMKALSVIEIGLSEDEEKYFGNARFIRNLYEKTIQNQFSRVSKMVSPTKGDFCKVTSDDFTVPSTFKKDKKTV
jgi:stage V sporulation protein K